MFCFINYVKKYITRLWNLKRKRDQVHFGQPFYNRRFPAAAFSLTVFVYSRVKSSGAD